MSKTQKLPQIPDEWFQSPVPFGVRITSRTTTADITLEREEGGFDVAVSITPADPTWGEPILMGETFDTEGQARAEMRRVMEVHIKTVVAAFQQLALPGTRLVLDISPISPADSGGGQ